jgi:hypothetical protein
MIQYSMVKERNLKIEDCLLFAFPPFFQFRAQSVTPVRPDFFLCVYIPKNPKNPENVQKWAELIHFAPQQVSIEIKKIQL